ncbi:hypothetical protein GGD38_006497 [Chitinophagaceae bacterium OAS944]|nr:hypothetical protein [Chitinophagaceae bacterium OAS944]
MSRDVKTCKFFEKIRIRRGSVETPTIIRFIFNILHFGYGFPSGPQKRIISNGDPFCILYHFTSSRPDFQSFITARRFYSSDLLIQVDTLLNRPKNVVTDQANLQSKKNSKRRNCTDFFYSTVLVQRNVHY